jgi:DNA-directed RNA polymerase subunit RPC12/RpoP
LCHSRKGGNPVFSFINPKLLCLSPVPTLSYPAWNTALQLHKQIAGDKMETRCSYCGYRFVAPDEYSGKKAKCPACKQESFLNPDFPHNRNEAERVDETEDRYICTECGTSTSDLHLKGSGTIELVLWLFILWPIALVYTLWRRCIPPYYVCPQCNHTSLVPSDSPVGKKISVGKQP